MEPFLSVSKAEVRVSFHNFLEHLLENYEVDEMSGQFKCGKCGCLIFLDWFEKEEDGCMCTEGGE